MVYCKRLYNQCLSENGFKQTRNSKRSRSYLEDGNRFKNESRNLTQYRMKGDFIKMVWSLKGLNGRLRGLQTGFVSLDRCAQRGYVEFTSNESDKET